MVLNKEHLTKDPGGEYLPSGLNKINLLKIFIKLYVKDLVRSILKIMAC